MQRTAPRQHSGGMRLASRTPPELEILRFAIPESAAAAGGAAAFADVAAAGRAHLGAAGEAERSVRGAALLGLDQFGRAVRSGRKGGDRWLGLSLSRGGNRGPFGMRLFDG